MTKVVAEESVLVARSLLEVISRKASLGMVTINRLRINQIRMGRVRAMLQLSWSSDQSSCWTRMSSMRGSGLLARWSGRDGVDKCGKMVRCMRDGLRMTKHMETAD